MIAYYVSIIRLYLYCTALDIHGFYYINSIGDFNPRNEPFSRYSRGNSSFLKVRAIRDSGDTIGNSSRDSEKRDGKRDITE